ncbi:MAG TPA: alpha/beta fold hydrolase [Acidimicrobiia bacterium]|jgi:3-oxoadipate enol-lactonase
MEQHADRRSASTKGSTIAVDGVPLYYELVGAGASAPRVAMLHGLGMDTSMWRAVENELRSDASILLCDLRGHGKSPLGDVGRFTPEGCTEDLWCVLDAVGWKDAVLVGWSLGGVIAAQAAATHPSRTGGLVLVSTTAAYGPGGAVFWSGLADMARNAGLDAVALGLVGRWFSDTFSAAREEEVRHLRRTFAATPIAAFDAACAVLGGLDQRSLLPMIEAPTEVVVGSDDPATTPAMAAELVESINHAQLTEISGARHLVPVERPHEVAASVRAVIERTR